MIPLGLFVGTASRWGWATDLAAGAAAGLLLIGLWEGMRRIAVFAELARRLESEMSEMLGGLAPAQALALSALSGFAEELFFRGAVQGSLGWLAAGILFALLHTGPGPAFRVWSLYAALAGALFGALMLWRGNLAAPIVAHFLVNAVNLRRLQRRWQSRGSAGGDAPRGPELRVW
ncbi:MAG TPA: CPBP family intramembrane glutamic endopeptidase [Thermoanaerobaculia bacterium]|nr:CPBP family intramembrane glutamic endopeptidase [Thermoanaerobaculia bacterium]